jgi:hypothetical protein
LLKAEEVLEVAGVVAVEVVVVGASVEEAPALGAAVAGAAPHPDSRGSGAGVAK